MYLMAIKYLTDIWEHLYKMKTGYGIAIFYSLICINNSISLEQASDTEKSLCECFKSESSNECLRWTDASNIHLLLNSDKINADELDEKYSDPIERLFPDEAVIPTDVCKIEDGTQSTICNLKNETKLLILSTGSARSVSVIGDSTGDVIVCEGSIAPHLSNLIIKSLNNSVLSKGAVQMPRQFPLSLDFSNIEGHINFSKGLTSDSNQFLLKIDLDSPANTKHFDVSMSLKNVNSVLFNHRCFDTNSARVDINGAEHVIFKSGAFKTIAINENTGLVAENIKHLELSSAFGSYMIINDCMEIDMFRQSVPKSVSLLSLSRISTVNFHENAILNNQMLSVTIDSVNSLYLDNSFLVDDQILNKTVGDSPKLMSANSLSTFAVRNTTFKLISSENQFVLSREILISNVTFKRSKFFRSNLSFVAPRIVVEAGLDTPSTPGWVHLCEKVKQKCLLLTSNERDHLCPTGYNLLSNQTFKSQNKFSCQQKYFWSSSLWLNVFYIFIALAFVAVLSFSLILVGIGIQRKKAMCIWKPEKCQMNSTTESLMANEERFMKFSEILHICGGEQHVVTTLPRPSKNGTSQRSKRSQSASQIPENSEDDDKVIKLIDVKNYGGSANEDAATFEDISLYDEVSI